MKRIIFATLLLAGTSASFPAQAQMFDCTSGGASLALAAVDGVISAFFGGRASQSAQAVQIREAVIANFCAASMNDKLISLAEIELRNIAQGSVNGIPGINGMISRTTPGLGQGGFLSTEEAIRDQYRMVFPDVFPPMTGTDLASISRDIALHERQSHMNAAGIQNRSVQEGIGSLKRARDYAAAGKAGEGIRAELQAGNAIQGEQLAALNSLTAATVGGQRAELERRLSDEAIKEASNARADDYMASLGVCANCGVNRTILE